MLINFTHERVHHQSENLMEVHPCTFGVADIAMIGVTKISNKTEIRIDPDVRIQVNGSLDEVAQSILAAGKKNFHKITYIHADDNEEVCTGYLDFSRVCALIGITDEASGRYVTSVNFFFSKEGDFPVGPQIYLAIRSADPIEYLRSKWLEAIQNAK